MLVRFVKGAQDLDKSEHGSVEKFVCAAQARKTFEQRAEGPHRRLASQRLGEHFVEAEIKSFGYDELDSAIAWASEGAAPRAKASTSESRTTPSS